MRRTGMFVAILVTMTAAACESPSAPQASAGPGLEPDGMLIAEMAVTASATGAAHREFSGHPVILNFSAVERADGSVSGGYFYRAVAQNLFIRVDVTCMTVVDNRAWIAGVIVDASENAAGLIGTVSYFYTTDNGEGAAADTDEVSLVRAGDVLEEAALFCAELPTVLPNREVLHGNVNVTG